MKNKIFIYFLIILLLSSNGTCPQPEQTAQAEEISAGTLDPNKPVLYNGVVIQGNAQVSEDGSISGTVTLPEMNDIEITNVDDFESYDKGFIGVATEGTIINDQKLGSGTVFQYNKETKEIIIVGEGTINMFGELTGYEDVITVGKDQLEVEGENIRVTEEGVVILGKGGKLTMKNEYSKKIAGIYTDHEKDYYTIIAKSDDTKIEYDKDVFTVKITGNAELISTTGEIFDINGGATIYSEREYPWKDLDFTQIDFEGSGISKYSGRVLTPRDVNTFTVTPPQTFSYSNYYVDESGNKVPVDSTLYLGSGTGSTEPENYLTLKQDESLYALKTKTQIEAKGKGYFEIEYDLSQSTYNREPDIGTKTKFSYTGQDEDTYLVLKSFRGIFNTEFTNYMEEEGELARMEFGNKEMVISSDKEEVNIKWNTESLFNSDPVMLASGKVAENEIESDGLEIESYTDEWGTTTYIMPKYDLLSIDAIEALSKSGDHSIQVTSSSGPLVWLLEHAKREGVRIVSMEEFEDALEDWPTEWD